MSTQPASELDRIREAIRTAPSPTRSQARTQRLWLSWGAACVLAATSSMHGMSPFNAKPWRYTLTLVVGVGLTTSLLSIILHRYSTSILGPRRELLKRANKLAVPALALGSVLGNLASPETLRWPNASLSHVACMVVLLMSGGLIALFGVLALRHADPLTPRTTAAAIGAVAGAWASMAVSLQCMLSDPLHTLGSHVLPVAIIMILSTRFGARAIGLHDV